MCSSDLGATSPRRLRGPSVGGDQPQVGWCAPPPRPKRMGEWEGANPRSRWALRPTLVAPPSPPLGRTLDGFGGCRHPWGGNPRWGPAPPPSPIYTGGIWGCQTHENVSLSAQPYPSPSSSSPAVLGEALRDCHAPPSPPRRRAAAGWSLPQPLPLSLLDQGVGDVTGLHVC